jgi:hypothetical protein
MKNKKTLFHLIILILCLIAYYLLSCFVLTVFDFSIFTNNFSILLINIVLAILMFFLFFILNEKLKVWKRRIFHLFWTIFVLGIYFFIGYIFTGNLLISQQSHWMNLLSVSLLMVIGIIFWFMLYFNKGSSGGGWITIKNIEWVFYSSFFAYTLPLSNNFHNNRIKKILFLAPFLTVFLIWLGMELKKLKA